MSTRFVGLMSGTSMDGIDAVLVDFANAGMQLLASSTTPYPDQLRKELLAEIRKPLSEPVDPDGRLDCAVGDCFLQAAQNVIAQSGVAANDIVAVGTHGQTLRHQPDADPPFTLQIGAPQQMATQLGIPVVANFRAADIAAGGQGAPLVPPFHAWLFRADNANRVVANIGGIANITILPRSGPITGFDTGPGNNLMDAWAREHLAQPFDRDGVWAASGSVIDDLLERLLSDAYFVAEPPKSTGFEYFNRTWLEVHRVAEYPPADVQATLCELSARTLADAISAYAANTGELFLCGGGTHNKELVGRLARNIPEIHVASTAEAGLSPDWVEATAFAWLAMRKVSDAPGNLPSVTGATKSVQLGELHFT